MVASIWTLISTLSVYVKVATLMKCRYLIKQMASLGILGQAAAGLWEGHRFLVQDVDLKDLSSVFVKIKRYPEEHLHSKSFL